MRISSHVPLLLCLTIGTSSLAAAGDISPPLVVTGSRIAGPTDDVILPVLVIDREEILARQPTDLSELLATLPGIDIGRNGGPGQPTSLFLRGTESNHVLILVDGVRMNPATIGGAQLQHIDPGIVERIEVIRGPRAALYGDQALGGVINIITRRSDRGSGFDASLRSGSDATAGADLGLALASERWSFSADAGYERTDGYAFRVGSPEEPGYRNTTLSLAGGYRGDRVGVELSHWSAAGEVEYLDFLLDPLAQDTLNRTTQLSMTMTPSARWRSTLRVSDMAEDIQQQQSTDFVRSQRTGLDWTNRVQLGGLLLGLGLNLEHERARSLSFGTAFDEATDDAAVYAELIGGRGVHDWMAALRYSDYDSFGGQTTGNLEYGYRSSDSLRWFATGGTAFRAPDATDRYGFGGDPDLLPERSTSYELGAEVDLAAGQLLRISGYHTVIRDLIAFDLATFSLSNIDAAQIRGLELSYELVSGSWLLDAAVVFQDPEDVTTGEDLPRRSSESFDLGLGRSWGRFSLRADLQAVGPRRDTAFSTVELGGYVLLDLAGSWRLSDAWTARLRVGNLTDTDYQTAGGFLGRGRNLSLSVDYRPGSS